jgi:hypothetical protein
MNNNYTNAMQLTPLQLKYVYFLYQLYFLMTRLKHTKSLIHHTSESNKITTRKDIPVSQEKTPKQTNNDYDAYANISNHSYDGIEISNANGAMSAAFRVAFNDAIGPRKNVESFNSTPGEKKGGYLGRLSSRVFGLSEANSVENCGCISERITSVPAGTNDIGRDFRTEIFTDNDPLQCSVSTTCSYNNSEGFYSTNESIHAHVASFRITRDFKKAHPDILYRSSRGRADINSFSPADYTFVNKTGLNLYLARENDRILLKANQNDN